MGFGSEEITVVGSSAHNLAGDPAKRGNYLKNTIVHSVLSGASGKDGIGKNIFNAHLQGPGIKLQQFARWAESSGYEDRVGKITGFLLKDTNFPLSVFNHLFPNTSTKEYKYLSHQFAGANYQYLAEAYLKTIDPFKLDIPFTVYPEMIRVGFHRWIMTGKLIINFGGAAPTIIFTPAAPIQSVDDVLYLQYAERDVVDPTETTEFSYVSTFPPTDGFIGSTSPVISPVNLEKITKTTVSYSDSRPDEVTTTTKTTTTVFSGSVGEYAQYDLPIPSTVHSAVDQTTFLTLVKDYEVVWVNSSTTSVEVVEGVTVTIVIDILQQEIREKLSVKKVVRTTRDSIWSRPYWFVLAKGVDSFVDKNLFNAIPSEETGRYLPIIPIRIENQFITESTNLEQYTWNQRAVKKAFGKKKMLNTLMDNLASNSGIEDIDHAWVVFGISMGSKEPTALRYIFEFFKRLSLSKQGAGTSLSAAEYAAAIKKYWEDLKAYESSEGGFRRPPKPAAPPAIATYVFRTYSTRRKFGFGKGTVMEPSPWKYNISITAKGGKRTEGIGFNSLAKNKVGTSWIRQKPSITVTYREKNSEGYYESREETTSVFSFGSQISSTLWEEYEFFDVVHINYVLDGHSVTTLLPKAISEGENSGFLLPINVSIFKDSGLVTHTQLSLECSYLVINYYDVQKVPWYKSGFFQIVLVIIVIVVAVHTGYIGPESSGLLGTNAAVGAAIGLTGTSAVLIGAIANALAAAIVSAVITKASTAIFGDQIGNILGAVLSMVAVWYGSGGEFGSMDNMLQGLTKSDNLLKMTLSGADMVSSHLQTKAEEIMAETAELIRSSQDRIDEITQLAAQYLGGSGVDPTVVSDATRHLVESPEQFLGRTLMTGDDIVKTTIDLIEKFPEPQLSLPYMDRMK